MNFANGRRILQPTARRATPRRGRIICREYVAWMHETFPCLVGGGASGCRGPLTLHHVRHHQHHNGLRELTSKNDYRSLLLCEAHHLNGAGPHAIHTMTALGAWEAFHRVNIEHEIQNYNNLWRQAGNEI